MYNIRSCFVFVGRSTEMCSAENIMGSKLMLAGVKLATKNKEEPLLREYTPEPTKPTKGSSFKQVRVTGNRYFR